MEQNVKASLRNWVNDNCSTAKRFGLISQKEKELLLAIGYGMAEFNYLRGDISEIWAKLGYGPDKLHDLYL